MGSFVLYFLVYQLVGTNAVTSRGQSELRNELQREWTAAAVAPAADPKEVVLSGRPAARPWPSRTSQDRARQQDRRRGRRPRRAAQGAGLPASRARSCPGRTAPSGVSGHPHDLRRALYRLNELAKGDTITVVTKEAIYTYTVTRTAIVRPTDNTQVLDDVEGPDGKPKATITLTTCHPATRPDSG